MAVDEETAVAGLVGAKDIEALEAAIGQASFLDSKPGESRQKLRGGQGEMGGDMGGLRPTTGRFGTGTATSPASAPLAETPSHVPLRCSGAHAAEEDEGRRGG